MVVLFFGIIVFIVLFWVIVIIFFIIVGGIVGKNVKVEFNASVRITKYSRDILALLWYCVMIL